MDEEEVHGLVLGLCSSNRQLQRYIADTYFSDDIVFRHILGSARGKENVYRLYRLATTIFRYKVTFYDYMRSGNRAMLKTELAIRVAPFFLLRYHFPTITLLEFRADPVDPKAPLKLCLQEDHHSMYAVLWLLGWPWSYLADLTLQRFQGVIGSCLGAAVDWACDGMEALHAALGCQPAVMVGADGTLLKRNGSVLRAASVGIPTAAGHA